MTALALDRPKSYPVPSLSARSAGATRRRGEAQREILLHMLEHKEKHDGRMPTYAQLAEYMHYAHANCARHTVTSILNRNRPGRPFMIYVNDHFGWHYLDVDDDGHLITPKGKYIAHG